MAEKRVSVRLVAEGGRQVRADLEGIGDAGARGFGRLSTEMELANTRLASFARKAGIALAAVTVAAAAAAWRWFDPDWKPSARKPIWRLH
jgi:hypothetical protein